LACTEKVLDARFVVPQHRERIFIVGFKDTLDFKFPTLPNLNPKIRDILEDEVNNKYTLTDHLWQYLQNYADKHRKKGNGFGYGFANLDGISRTLSARYYKDGSEILIPQKNKNPRRLTPRECARLLGFPETFKVVVSDTRAYRLQLPCQLFKQLPKKWLKVSTRQSE
jgi:DNA (cytosine-5)-methyltransferase 1